MNDPLRRASRRAPGSPPIPAGIASEHRREVSPRHPIHRGKPAWRIARPTIPVVLVQGELHTMTLKSAILAACVAAGAFCSSSAFAGWEIYDAGTATWGDGTVVLSGPTSATVNGIPAPCTAIFTLTVTGGV